MENGVVDRCISHFKYIRPRQSHSRTGEVGDDEILKRLLKRAEIEGRKDDTKEVIENRIQIYNTQTQPLIDFYKNKNKFQALHGIGEIDEIFAGICKMIDEHI